MSAPDGPPTTPTPQAPYPPQNPYPPQGPYPPPQAWGGQPPPPQGPPPYWGPPQGPPPGGNNRRAIIGIVIAVALIAGLVVGVVLATSGDDEEPVPVAAEEDSEIFLEPIADEGTDPFTGEVATPTPTTASTTTTTAPPTQGAPAVRSFSGSRAGLYGGTRSQTTCDRAQLVSFLQENEDKGEAWADVFDISFSEIPTFVDQLTPVLLRSDTRVTNHGYRQGRATVVQSVLQAGSAVLVDRYGAPAVRCYCGNPLLVPRAARSPRYTGPRWPGFTPSGLTVIQKTTVVMEEFVLVDWVTGERYRRPWGTDGDMDRDPEGLPTPTTTTPTTLPTQPAPSPTPTQPPATQPPPTQPPVTQPPAPEPQLGTGDVQVTLRWDADVDLDLSVTDPAGSTVSYSNTPVASGGQLDVDRQCGSGTANVENIFWPTGQAPGGEYVVSVNHYSACGGGGSTGFSVTISLNGAVYDTVSGSLAPGETREITRFTI